MTTVKNKQKFSNSPLEIAENKILELNNSDPNTVKALCNALRLSLRPIDSQNPSQSLSVKDIASQCNLSIDTLNDYQVVLSKKEGCQLIKSLGVGKGSWSDKLLKNYLTEETYHPRFDRTLARLGSSKFILTYAEIYYFFTQYIGAKTASPLPEFPKSLEAFTNTTKS